MASINSMMFYSRTRRSTLARDLGTVERRQAGIGSAHHRGVVALGASLDICVPLGDIAPARLEVHQGGQAIVQIDSVAW